MPCSKINELFFSPSGTTKTVVERIAEAFSVPRECFDLLESPPKEPVKLANTDCLLVGLPVFAGRIPAVCAQQLKQFQGLNTPAVAVVVYGNRDYEDALLELKNTLEYNGFIVVAAAAFVAQHSIFPEVGRGRPDEEDFLKIDAFRDACRKLLDTFSDSRIHPLTVKGHLPYRDPGEVSIRPTGNSDCTSCGLCAKICPVHAINSRNPKATDKKLCISCTACISSCPSHARSFRGPLYAIAGKQFSIKCAARREPDIFLE